MTALVPRAVAWVMKERGDAVEAVGYHQQPSPSPPVSAVRLYSAGHQGPGRCTTLTGQFLKVLTGRYKIREMIRWRRSRDCCCSTSR